MPAEFRPHGIAVNSLWPRTAITTAALQMIPGVDIAGLPHARDPGRRRLFILTSDAEDDDAATSSSTTRCSREHGVTDLERYSVTPGTKDFILDFFVD